MKKPYKQQTSYDHVDLTPAWKH